MDLGKEGAGAVWGVGSLPSVTFMSLTGRIQTFWGLRSWDLWRGGDAERRERLPGTLTAASPLASLLQAQTRAALLRVLQEDEEHWGSTEDWSSSLAQDVCEVGAGNRKENPPRGKVGPCTLFTPSHPPGPTQLLEEHTERAPRISQEFGERMAHCCLGGLAEFLQRYGGLGGRAQVWGVWPLDPDPRERGEMKEPRQDGQGCLGGDHRLCRAECPAGDPYPAVLHLSAALSPPTSFQQRVERFHENPGVRELPPDTYISRTISLVNCGPPLR